MSAQLTKYDYRSFQTNFDVKMALSRWPRAQLVMFSPKSARVRKTKRWQRLVLRA